VITGERYQFDVGPQFREEPHACVPWNEKSNIGIGRPGVIRRCTANLRTDLHLGSQMRFADSAGTFWILAKPRWRGAAVLIQIFHSALSLSNSSAKYNGEVPSPVNMSLSTSKLFELFKGTDRAPGFRTVRCVRCWPRPIADCPNACQRNRNRRRIVKSWGGR
jgi:hypothetical protein